MTCTYIGKGGADSRHSKETFEKGFAKHTDRGAIVVRLTCFDHSNAPYGVRIDGQVCFGKQERVSIREEFLDVVGTQEVVMLLGDCKLLPGTRVVQTIGLCTIYALD